MGDFIFHRFCHDRPKKIMGLVYNIVHRTWGYQQKSIGFVNRLQWAIPKSYGYHFPYQNGYRIYRGIPWYTPIFSHTHLEMWILSTLNGWPTWLQRAQRHKTLPTSILGIFNLGMAGVATDMAVYQNREA